MGCLTDFSSARFGSVVLGLRLAGLGGVARSRETNWLTNIIFNSLSSGPSPPIQKKKWWKKMEMCEDCFSVWLWMMVSWGLKTMNHKFLNHFPFKSPYLTSTNSSLSKHIYNINNFKSRLNLMRLCIDITHSRLLKKIWMMGIILKLKPDLWRLNETH